MRLLNAHTLEFKEFYEGQCPPYVILSHTWGSEEVTYKDMRKRKFDEQTEIPRGYWKICKCAEKALMSKWDWLWADTICIDAKSSAELSEAINSMYGWYAGSETCFVYMEDVVFDTELRDAKGFEESRWFTRGWTLQELLAPRRLYFFDQNWTLIKLSKQELRRRMSAITGIALGFLEKPYTASVAQKMSWVADRATSRPEDIAYCMLGLFDINMPMLYGEGSVKAFVRLQMEILKKTGDDSIFAWSEPEEDMPEGFYAGMLALSPSWFHGKGLIQHHPGRIRSISLPDYQMTTTGLEVSGLLVYAVSDLEETLQATLLGSVMAMGTKRELRVVLLSCHDAETKARVAVVIIGGPRSESEVDNVFIGHRCLTNRTFLTSMPKRAASALADGQRYVFPQYWR